MLKPSLASQNTNILIAIAHWQLSDLVIDHTTNVAVQEVAAALTRQDVFFVKLRHSGNRQLARGVLGAIEVASHQDPAKVEEVMHGIHVIVGFIRQGRHGRHERHDIVDHTGLDGDITEEVRSPNPTGGIVTIRQGQLCSERGNEEVSTGRAMIILYISS